MTRAKKGKNWHYLGDLGYNFSELSTPPSHTYDNEYRFFSEAQLTEIVSLRFFVWKLPVKWQPYEVALPRSRHYFGPDITHSKSISVGSSHTILRLNHIYLRSDVPFLHPDLVTRSLSPH